MNNMQMTPGSTAVQRVNSISLRTVVPPEILYHGTGEKFAASIEEQGLIPKSRLYVHLSRDVETAHKVGIRHGKPVIYKVKSGEMSRKNFKYIDLLMEYGS